MDITHVPVIITAFVSCITFVRYQMILFSRHRSGYATSDGTTHTSAITIIRDT